MLIPVQSSAFKSDVKRQKKRGKDMGKLKKLIELLVNEDDIPPEYVDHPCQDTGVGTVMLILKVTGY